MNEWQQPANTSLKADIQRQPTALAQCSITQFTPPQHTAHN